MSFMFIIWNATFRLTEKKYQKTFINNLQIVMLFSF